MIIDVRLYVDKIFSLLGCYVVLIGICVDVWGESNCPIFKKTAWPLEMGLIGRPKTSLNRYQ